MTSPSSSTAQVTQLLVAWSKGDQSALKTLTPLVHKELHRLAHHYMRLERAGHTLQTTALINEAYLKLIDQAHMKFENRTQFFALAATLMRHILVDHARSRQYLKRGGGVQRVSLDKALTVCVDRDEDLVALDEALTNLEATDALAAKVVKLRYFAGLTMPQTAQALGMPLRTVERNWTYARTWLHRALSKPD